MSHVSRGDLHAYLDGALGAYPEGEANRVRRHLDDCAQCSGALDEERQLRLVASQILQATADAPVDLAPFEELVARAGELEATGVTGRVSRIRTLRMAATVVISLGAGWAARDLLGPAADSVTTRPNAVVMETEARVAPVAEDAMNPFSVEPEEGPASQSNVYAEVAAPVQSRDLDAEDVPAIARAVRSEVSVPAESGPASVAAERTGEIDAVFTDEVAGRRDVEGGGIRSTLPREPAAPAQATDASRRRLEAAAPADLRDNRAQSLAARGIAASVLEEQVAKPGLDAALANELGDVVMDEMSVTGRTSSLIVPGLSIRDVRLLGPDLERGATVVVVQELDDGRAVELWFRMNSDDVLGVAGSVQEEAESRERDRLQQSRDLGEGPLPAGWRRVARPVNGGVAVIRGPLSEVELSTLLDAAVGGR